MDFLTTLFAQTDFLIVALIFVFGIAAFILSTISGGGGALVLVPVLNWLIGVGSTVPVLNLGSFLGRPARLVIFWKHIQWRVCLYYAPAAIVGAVIGSWLFSSFRIEWLQVVVGLFLISTVWQYSFGKKEKSFNVKLWYFAPLVCLYLC